ncbi:hypothetical protein ACFL5H_01505 [Candidatus Latescibacterota bacterium]
MPCLIALVVFGILGIFSATHRLIALEAFDCVFKRLRFKPCDSGLNVRLKSQIIGKLMKRSPRLASFSFRNFEALSWVFTILMVASLFYSGLSAYRFAMYGNCHGADSQEECVFEGLSRIINSAGQESQQGAGEQPSGADE